VSILSNEPSQHEKITTIAEYIKALDQICALSNQDLFIFEKDFVNIGFNNSARIEMLRSLLLPNPNHRLLLLAHDTRQISQNCPRLMTLLRQFGHNMYIYQTPKNLQHITEPFAVGDKSNFVRRFHLDHTPSIYGQNDSINASLLKSRFMEMWQVSQPSPWTSTFSL
jgi:hypothetical protein